VTWREKVKDYFHQMHGHKLTYTPIFFEAIIKALRDFPMINSSVSGDKLILHKQINLGMAVALQGYNLIVPVIHNADQYSLVGLVQAVNDIAERARSNRLKPDELAGGTYTVTNVGSFGNIMGTPIILQPQVAIMALGMIVKKPAVIETPEGDSIGIRYKMFLSHTYDHRVIDGALGGSFIRKVATYFESFDTHRKI
jgi:2-oxoglutarate dehydrogenase E2 component (dihydrolipoamide succinyltransferase)